MMINLSTIVDYEKQLAIGIGNAIEIEYDNCCNKSPKFIHEQSIECEGMCEFATQACCTESSVE